MHGIIAQARRNSEPPQNVSVLIKAHNPDLSSMHSCASAELSAVTSVTSTCSCTSAVTVMYANWTKTKIQDTRRAGATYEPVATSIRSAGQPHWQATCRAAAVSHFAEEDPMKKLSVALLTLLVALLLAGTSYHGPVGGRTVDESPSREFRGGPAHTFVNP